MRLEKEKRLRNLLHIEDLRPAFIAFALDEHISVDPVQSPRIVGKLQELLMLNAVNDLCFLVSQVLLSELPGLLPDLLSSCHAVIVIILFSH